jgi:hypothetical protein
MTKEKKYKNIAGLNLEVLNYEGVVLTKSPLTNTWYVLLRNASPPFFGTLKEVREFVDEYKTLGDIDNLQPYEEL